MEQRFGVQVERKEARTGATVKCRRLLLEGCQSANSAEGLPLRPPLRAQGHGESMQRGRRKGLCKYQSASQTTMFVFSHGNYPVEGVGTHKHIYELVTKAGN